MKAAEIIDAYKALCEKARIIAMEFVEDGGRFMIRHADNVLVKSEGDTAFFAYWDYCQEGWPPSWDIRFPVAILDMDDSEFSAWQADKAAIRAVRERAREAERMELRQAQEARERASLAELKAKYESE